MIEPQEYFKDVEEKLRLLLSERRDASYKDENALQAFFEQNPSSLLSALSGIDSQYNIYGGVVISQPQIKSFNGDRNPDFLIVTANSLNFFFNFIEIEDPSKKFFTSSNEQQPSSEFNQAFNQVIQWSSFDKGEVEAYCTELLRTLFEGTFDNTAKKLKNYNFILLYGFSDQVNERQNHILQKYFKQPELHHCTYSRLINNLRKERPLFTVKKETATNKYKAIGFVPFKRYTHEEWSGFHNIIGKQELIQKSTSLNDEEKNDLIKKIDELDSKSVREILDQYCKLHTKSFDDLDDLF